MSKKFRNNRRTKNKGRTKIKIHKIYSKQRLPLLLKIKMSKRKNNKCKTPDSSYGYMIMYKFTKYLKVIIFIRLIVIKVEVHVLPLILQI
jgi:hypothetical protein